MGKKSSQKTPDVVGAEREKGEISRQAQLEQLYADRPDQYNPFGSVQWGQQSTIDPATGERVTRWTQGQGLSPQMQRMFDQRMGFTEGLSGIQSGMLNRIQQEMGGAPDWAQFGDVQGLEYDPMDLRGRAEEAAYGRSVSRLDPQFAQREQALEINLRNKGLRPGDEAYDAAMGNFERARADAYEQARRGAVGEGRAEAGQLFQQQLSSTQLANALRDKQIQEHLAKRGFSLGEARALAPEADLQALQQTFAGGQ